MMLLLFALSFALSVASPLVLKQSSNVLRHTDTDGVWIFSLVNGVTASVFFFLLNGCRFVMNAETWRYAVIYSAVCIYSQVSGVLIYRYMRVADYSIFSSAVGIIGSTLIGKFFFHEEVGPLRLLRVFLVITAVIVNNLHKRDEASQKKRGGIILPVLLTASFISSCVGTFISNSYAKSPTVTDEKSYFLAVNLIIIAADILVLAARYIKNPSAGLPFMRMKPSHYGLFALNTVLSNISSLVSVSLLRIADIGVVSPVTAALGIVSCAIVSLILKEKLHAGTIAAIGLAVLSVIIGK